MRYTDVTTTEREVLNDVVGNFFEEYKNLSIKLIFDTKKRKKNGKYVFACIKPVDDLNCFLMTDDAKYLIFLDQQVWEKIDDSDRKRIVKHELRHIFIDASKSKPYKLKPHDYETFREEIEEEANGGDPLWIDRLTEVAISIYESDDEDDNEEEE